MINKQNIWFLTLFSLILVLSIYYITMPSELSLVNTNNKQKKDTEVVVKESDVLTALRVEKEEQRKAETDEANKTLNNKDSNTEQKNGAFEKLKFINSLKAKEENLEKKIKEKFKLDAFVKIDDNQVRVVVSSNEQDVTLANNIMRLVQEEFDDKMYISVKFEK